jgi:hypothetical protein
MSAAPNSASVSAGTVTGQMRSPSSTRPSSTAQTGDR